MTIRNLLWTDNFQQKKVLEKLLCFHTGLTKEDLVRHYDDEIGDDIIEKITYNYNEYVNDDKPLEYIFGYVEFFKRKFAIDGRSLIPRPETEYMIEAVNEHVQEMIGHHVMWKHVMMDIGTWTWVLGLSVLLEHPKFFDVAYLTEYYEDTLSLARENYQHYKYQLWHHTHIHVLQSNLIEFFQPISRAEHLPPGKREFITLVANLPYIPDEVFDTQTEDNVRKREPRPAFVGWFDGLDFYREMFEQIFSYKKSSQERTMFLEMMTRQVDILRKEFGERIEFDEIKTFHFNIRIVKAIIK